MTSAEDLIKHYRRQDQLNKPQEDEIDTGYTNFTTGQRIYITKNGPRKRRVSILPNKWACWD
jgi:hypothetical protein